MSRKNLKNTATEATTIEATATEATEANVERFPFKRFLSDETVENLTAEEMEKRQKEITSEEFTEYANDTTFEQLAVSMKWNAPYIGKHESGVYTVFHKVANVSVKRFLSVKYSKEMLQKLELNHKSELSTCNAFLNHIAQGDKIVSVHDVKEKLNTLNADELKVYLTATDNNDNEYVITVTNKMIRLLLVEKARANKDMSNFKRVTMIDLMDVIITGLSREYRIRNGEE